jgi:hypothetical protein
MPGLINSAPDCNISNEAAEPADDSADFILQANYEDCAGFMTFGPGTTWGDGGAGAATEYYILIGLGAVVVLAVFILWLVLENGRLVAYARRGILHGPAGEEEVVPPGTMTP